MRFNPAVLLVLALSALASACQTGADEYPSLAVRPAERISGTLDPAMPESVQPLPPPAPAGVLSRLNQLAADATVAHNAFGAEVAAARNAVNAARGSAVGSEAWARAQVALAGLQSRRSQAMIALADLDRLYVDAAVQGAGLDQISVVRQLVADQVEQQDATIEDLARGLQ